MIKAIMTDASGNPINGSEREFSEKQWVRMRYAFGDKLRWLEVKPKKVEKPKRRKSPRLEKRREELKEKTYKSDEKLLRMTESAEDVKVESADETEETTNKE